MRTPSRGDRSRSPPAPAVSGRSRWSTAALLGGTAALLVVLSLRPEGPEPAPEWQLIADPPPQATPAARLSPEVAALLSGPRRLRGRVAAPDGRPLAGVRVRWGPREVASGAGGGFEIDAARGRLRLDLEGHFPLSLAAAELAGELSLPGAEPAREVPFVLVPGCRLEGRVSTAEGAPRPGATVLVGADLLGGVHEITTAERGRWRSPLLGAGTVEVLVRHRDFLVRSGAIRLAVPGQTVEWNVTMESGLPLWIQVEDPGGSPLPDAQVWIDPAAGEGAAETLFLGRTDDLGRLQAHRPRGRPARVRAVLAGYRTAVRELRDESVTLVLAPAPLLRARAVESATGLPVTPASVRLEILHEGSFQPAPHGDVLFHSLAGGKIRAGVSLPGTYRLVVAGVEALEGISEAIVFDGRTSPREVEVLLERRLALEGTVQHGGRLLEDAEVRIVRVPERGGEVVTVLDPVRTGPDGRFLFPGLEPGTYRVAARHRLHAEVLSPPFLVALRGGPLRPLPFLLPRPARLHGKVRSPTGEPVTGAALRLEGPRILPRAVRSGAGGEYTFDGLPPGRFHLALLAGEEPGGTRRPEAREREILVGEGADVVYDLLGGAGRCEMLDVRDGAGADRIERVDVVAPVPAPDLREETGGRFLPGGPEIERGEPLELRLQDPGGESYRGEVEVRILAGERQVFCGRRRVDGVLEIPALAAGEYTLEVRAPGRRARGRLVVPALLGSDGVETDRPPVGRPGRPAEAP